MEISRKDISRAIKSQKKKIDLSPFTWRAPCHQFITLSLVLKEGLRDHVALSSYVWHISSHFDDKTRSLNGYWLLSISSKKITKHQTRIHFQGNNPSSAHGVLNTILQSRKNTLDDYLAIDRLTIKRTH